MVVKKEDIERRRNMIQLRKLFKAPVVNPRLISIQNELLKEIYDKNQN